MDKTSGIKVFALTDTGRVRPSNQDCVYACAEEGLLIAADGMGGHAGGEIASDLAVRSITELLRGALPDQPGALATYGPFLLRDAIRQADAAVRDRAISEPSLAGMGTTVVVALCRPEGIVVAHVGDSRAYLLRGDGLLQVTRDHSVVGHMVDAGTISAAEARRHNLRNVITRCLGGQGHAEPDVRLLNWMPGDILLLCTDGLTNMLEDQEIEQILRAEADDLAACARRLAALANDRGGADNISVVLGRMEDDRG